MAKSKIQKKAKKLGEEINQILEDFNAAQTPEEKKALIDAFEGIRSDKDNKTVFALAMGGQGSALGLDGTQLRALTKKTGDAFKEQEGGISRAVAQNEIDTRATAGRERASEGAGAAQQERREALDLQREDLSTGFDAAEETIGAAGAQALDTRQQALAQALGGIEDPRDRLGALLDQSGGLFAGFEADPGFQFRLQQGEEAINRANAARGGRAGGRALKELSEFNQGLASQAFGDFAQRRAQEAGVMGQSDQEVFARALSGSQLGLEGGQDLSQTQLAIGESLGGLQAGSGQAMAGATGDAASQVLAAGLQGTGFGTEFDLLAANSPLALEQLAAQERMERARLEAQAKAAADAGGIVALGKHMVGSAAGSAAAAAGEKVVG
jgi:hypothetical protein